MLRRRSRKATAGKTPPRGGTPVILQIQLSAAQATGADGPKWGQIATEGEYRGYLGGDMPFEFTKDTFAQVVANLRAHPNFVVGADGYGTEGIVPWDFNHASEQNPTLGTLPEKGAPAQGWTLDMEVRMGADGKAQLWALTQWLEPLRTYIQNKQYKWASVSLVFDAVDPVSGRNVGALITSVAATNTPFIEGMQALAASKVAAAWYGEMPDDPEDAFECLRDKLDMPATSGVADVAAEIAKLEAWATTGGAPPGVEVDELVGHVRQILNMPVLSDTAEVFAEVAKLLALMANPTVGAAEGDGSLNAAPPIQGNRSSDMDLKILASKLGVKADDAAVAESVDGLLALDGLVREKLDLGKANSKKLLDEARVALDAGNDASTQLAGILEKLGVKNAGDVMGRITELMATADKLGELMPTLKGLQDQVAEQMQEQQANDVQQAIASHFGGDEKHKAVLLTFHKTEGREAFLKQYPAIAPSELELTRSITGGGDAGQGAARPGSDAEQVVINLAGYSGNRTQRLMAFVKDQQGGDSLDFDAVHERAARLSAASIGDNPKVKLLGL